MGYPQGMLEIAQHEAAHVVVGVALGLRLRAASVDPAKQDPPGRAGPDDPGDDGFTLWDPRGPREAWLLMTAAGVAWERRTGGDLRVAASDLADLRRAGVRGQARLVALERAAWAVLAERAALHARLTRALLEGDLTARDVRVMARGIRMG